MPGEIGATDLAERLRRSEPILLLDVREPWEREIAHLPGDLHIPMNDLPVRLSEVVPPAGGVIVAYCHLGVRSWAVASFLEESGHRGVLSLEGGIEAWSVEVDPRLARY